MPRASHSPAAEPRVKRMRRLSSDEERERQAEIGYYGQSPVSLASQGSWHADVDHGTLGERRSAPAPPPPPPLDRPRHAVQAVSVRCVSPPPPPRYLSLCPTRPLSRLCWTGRSEPPPCVCLCACLWRTTNRAPLCCSRRRPPPRAHPLVGVLRPGAPAGRQSTPQRRYAATSHQADILSEPHIHKHAVRD